MKARKKLLARPNTAEGEHARIGTEKSIALLWIIRTGASLELIASSGPFQYNAAMLYASTLVSLILWLPALQAAEAQAVRVDFGRDVRPILERFCWKCHGA